MADQHADGGMVRQGLWALGGLIGAWVLLLLTFWLDIGVSKALPGVEGLAPDIAASATQAGLVAIAIIVALRLARRVTDVPAALWLGPLALTLYAWAAGAAQYMPGYYAPLRLPAMLTLGFLSAWLVDHVRTRSVDSDRARRVDLTSAST